MRRFLLTLTAVLFLAGSASAQQWTPIQDSNDMDRARELDRMRNRSTEYHGTGNFFQRNEERRQWQRDANQWREQGRRRQAEPWQGSGGGIRSNRDDGGW